MSIGGENNPLPENLFSGIRVLGSWVSFGVGGCGEHSPTWQPWTQVVPAAAFIATEISSGHPWEGDRQTVITARSPATPQGWSSKVVETAAGEEPHSMRGRRLGSLAGYLQIPFTYVVWQCSGAWSDILGLLGKYWPWKQTSQVVILRLRI